MLFPRDSNLQLQRELLLPENCEFSRDIPKKMEGIIASNEVPVRKSSPEFEDMEVRVQMDNVFT